MVAERKNITSFIPLNKIVKRAILDMYADYEKDQARYQAWAIDGLKKLTRETLKSGKRFAVININKNLNSAVLPCDFKEEIFVGLIDNCGEKVPLNINPNIANNFLIENEVPCDQDCPSDCKCYPKQLCNDLQTTQVINKILLNDTEYDQTVTTTLLPNGEYYKVTTTPIMNMVTSGIDYVDTKEYITTFDTATCGCIKPTETNQHLLAACNWDLYCCYCTNCRTGNTDFGGYRIFSETGTIHFDGSMIYDKVYLEYRGSLPKSGNEYLVPEVAYETLIEYTKYKSIANKNGVAQWERRDQFSAYERERTNMTKIMGRISLYDVVHSAMNVPQFVYNNNGCYTPSSIGSGGGASGSGGQVLVTSVQYVNAPSPTPVSPLRPTVIRVNGAELTGGMVYNNPILAGVPLLIDADPLNRYLTDAEFTLVPTGGFDLSPLGTVYGALDWFSVIPKWWLVP